MHLAPDAAVGGGHGRRIDAEIEQRRVNPGPADRGQNAVETRATGPLEAGHERAVKKHQIRHGPERDGRFLRVVTAAEAGLFTGEPEPQLRRQVTPVQLAGLGGGRPAEDVEGGRGQLERHSDGLAGSAELD